MRPSTFVPALFARYTFGVQRAREEYRAHPFAHCWVDGCDHVATDGGNGCAEHPLRRAECGTTSGYSRHRKLDEPTCKPRREAQRLRMRAYRARKAA